MFFSVVPSIQDCATFARRDVEKGTMGTVGWVFYPDTGHCRPQRTLVVSSNPEAVSGTVECGKGKFIFGEGLKRLFSHLSTCISSTYLCEWVRSKGWVALSESKGAILEACDL